MKTEEGFEEWIELAEIAMQSGITKDQFRDFLKTELRRKIAKNSTFGTRCQSTPRPSCSEERSQWRWKLFSRFL